MVNPPKPLFLEVAERIGITLCRDAMWSKNRCTWLGWVMQKHNQKYVPGYTACGGNVYGGTAGIALFLAGLYQHTGDRQLLRTLEGAINQAISVVDAIPSGAQHGFYSGLNGVAYALIRIASQLGRERLLERGLALMNSLREVPIKPDMIDVIAGSAGAIPAILYAARTGNRADLLEFALAHGEHLLKQAQEGEYGYSWSTLGGANKANLTGHSHGVAGIITALLELYHATNEQRFLKAALAGLRYEQHWFSPDHGNWPDLRKNEPTDVVNQTHSYPLAWCHGAPGIGLSRLRNAALLPENRDLRHDLEAAIQSTANSLSIPWLPGHGNYSLCHGAGGNAELLIMAGQQLNRPDLSAIAEKVGQQGYEFYVKQGLPWPCGIGEAGENPSLMLGTAGIGHFYLRLYDPAVVSSVLLITPHSGSTAKAG